jgi:FkbM family methyltransferase
MIAVCWPHGIERVINGEICIKVTPELRAMGENYEPRVWEAVVRSLRKGDVVADVGAHVGLYTLAMAQKVTSSGRVYAFEPSSVTFDVLERNISINDQASIVEAFQCAVGNVDGTVYFESGSDLESHIVPNVGLGSVVNCTRLDTVFARKRLDILKIDVEGYELEVLRGAQSLLSDKTRRPRQIFVEVHPYAWPLFGATGEQLLLLLQTHDYCIAGIDGAALSKITEYGEIVATSLEETRGRKRLIAANWTEH